MLRRHGFFFITLIGLGTAFASGCTSKVHLGGDDGGAGEACGPTTCNVGEVCCNASCGICTEPAGACPAIACLPDDGSTPPPLDGGPAPVDGGGGEECGPTTCNAGEVCCNASCGICTPPEGACPAIACSPEDGGTPPPLDGGPGEPCGSITCGAGLVCCNASCGICTEPDGACITLECADAGMPRTCGGGDACLPSEYCDYAAGCGIDVGTGICVPRPTSCTDHIAPVCGCDGVTYSNRCEAAARGADVLREGACPFCAPMNARGEGLCPAFWGYAWNGATCVGLSGCSCVGSECSTTYDTMEACATAHAGCPGGGGAVCGTIAGLTCGPSEWCNFDGGGCGFADGGGRCERRPEVCVDIYMPVCGCDGETYGNECYAHAEGVDIIHDGECATPPPSTDCRTTGCPSDTTCESCWGSYTCLPPWEAC